MDTLRFGSGRFNGMCLHAFIILRSKPQEHRETDSALCAGADVCRDDLFIGASQGKLAAKKAVVNLDLWYWFERPIADVFYHTNIRG